MNIQFNIMDNLLKVRKRDFVEAFCKKYPKAKPKFVEAELTAINKDYGISLYHNKGFIFNWDTLIHDGFEWGKYISSFNMYHPADFLTVGGDYNLDDSWAIHPNINLKTSSVLLDNECEEDGEALIICLAEEQIEQVKRFVLLGHLHSALQVVRNMLDYVRKGDGLWDDFFNRCKDCGDVIGMDESYCVHCEEY